MSGMGPVDSGGTREGKGSGEGEGREGMRERKGRGEEKREGWGAGTECCWSWRALPGKQPGTGLGMREVCARGWGAAPAQPPRCGLGGRERAAERAPRPSPGAAGVCRRLGGLGEGRTVLDTRLHPGALPEVFLP